MASILADLFSKFDWFEQALRALAYLVALVAGAAVFSSVYSSMTARKRDLAILRALGAHRGFLIAAVLGNRLASASWGCALGFGLYGMIASSVQEVLRTRIVGAVRSLGLEPGAGVGTRPDGGAQPGGRAAPGLARLPPVRGRRPLAAQLEVPMRLRLPLATRCLALAGGSGAVREHIRATALAGTAHDQPRPHVPHPPHGGTPVVVGDEAFHLELVRDPVEGMLRPTCWTGRWRTSCASGARG